MYHRDGAVDMHFVKPGYHDHLKKNEQIYADLLDELDEIDDGWESSVVKLDKQVSKMQDTINPFYETTCTLQELQTSIDDTLQELDEALAHYEVLERAEKMAQTPPEPRVSYYIQTFQKVQEAKEFFQQARPGRPEVVRCTNLFRQGKQNLERQFQSWLHEIYQIENNLFEYDQQKSYLDNVTNTLDDPFASQINLDPLLPEQSQQRLENIYQGCARVITWMNEIKSYYYVQEIADYRKLVEVSSCFALEEAIGRLESELARPHLTSTMTRLKRARSIDNLKRSFRSKSTKAVKKLKRMTSGEDGSHSTGDLSSKKQRKEDMFSKELMSAISGLLHAFIVFLQCFESILEDESEFILKILCMDQLTMVRVGGMVKSNSYSSSLRGEILTAVIEGKLTPLIEQSMALIGSCYKGIAKSPIHIGTGLTDLLHLLSTYRACSAKISRSLALTGDNIRRCIHSVGRTAEALIQITGEAWLEIFRTYVDDLKPSKEYPLPSTHRHGLTDTFFITVKKCARFSKTCGIINDDENYHKPPRQKFSAFTARAIGELKACLTAIAGSRFDPSGSSGAYFLFLYNNYSCILRYLTGDPEGELLQIIQLELPSILDIVKQDKRDSLRNYLQAWEIFFVETRPHKFPKKFTKFIIKQNQLMVSSEDDREEILAQIELKVNDYFESCPEELFEQNQKLYYEATESILMAQ